MRIGRVSSWILLLALPALALAALSCGDEEEEAAATPAAGETPAVTAPELADGTLQIGSDIAYAPIEFFEEGTENAMGLDVDLANAIAEELGVDVEFINTGFDGIISALQAERFDVIMSAMTVTEERQAEIDFVPYITAGTGILVQAGNPENIQTMEDLCGTTVAVQVGTIQVNQLEDQNELCAEKITISAHSSF